MALPSQTDRTSRPFMQRNARRSDSPWVRRGGIAAALVVAAGVAVWGISVLVPGKLPKTGESVNNDGSPADALGKDRAGKAAGSSSPSWLAGKPSSTKAAPGTTPMGSPPASGSTLFAGSKGDEPVNSGLKALADGAATRDAAKPAPIDVTAPGGAKPITRGDPTAIPAKAESPLPATPASGPATTELAVAPPGSTGPGAAPSPGGITPSYPQPAWSADVGTHDLRAVMQEG